VDDLLVLYRVPTSTGRSAREGRCAIDKGVCICVGEGGFTQAYFLSCEKKVIS